MKEVQKIERGTKNFERGRKIEKKRKEKIEKIEKY